MTPEALILVGAGCAVLEIDSRITATDDGWVESSRLLTLVENGSCDRVRLPLPAGVQLDDLDGKLQSDGKQRIDTARIEIPERGQAGDTEVLVHIPDAERGYKLSLNVTRTWTGRPTWVVGQEADWARIKPRGATESGKQWRVPWTAESPVTLSTERVGPAWDPIEPVAPWPLATNVETHRTLDLVIPPGDPQLKLFPGGGSEIAVSEQLKFPASDTDRAWLVPLRDGARDVSVRIEPEGLAETIVRPDSILVRLPAAEAPVQVGLRYVAPDAPSYGEVVPRPGESLTVGVDCEACGVSWSADKRSWWLVEAWHKPVLPSREALVKGLSYRFDALSVPEPGLPMGVRGAPTSWDLIGDLKEILLQRAAPVTWPYDPVWPRKPVVARKSGVITPTEAALIVRIYALQSKAASEWYLVRPASAGLLGGPAPVGIEGALVRVVWDGEERWIDPTCSVCAPFEIRPDFAGASVIGPSVDRSPTVSGSLVSELLETGERAKVRWTWTDAAALDLRLWLRALPHDERNAALAARLAGDGAEVVESTGLGEAGADVVVVATGPDPQRPLDASDTWLPWTGTVQWLHPGEADDASVPGDDLSWKRTTDGDQVQETWTIGKRRVRASQLEAIDVARAAVPEPEPPAEPQEPEKVQDP